MATLGRRKFSEYYFGLEEAAKRRYLQKLNSVSDKTDDPYTVSTEPLTVQSTLPDIQYPDIYNYLIETPSAYTKDDLKAYRSLDAYKYLIAGSVGEVSVHHVDDKVSIVRAKVRHSQSPKAPPLLPWVAANSDGTIVCSHCTCMAGLGEACSHIAAVMFGVETHNRMLKDEACTSKLCAWLPPTMRNVTFAPIAEIDFTAPSTKQKRSMSQDMPDQGTTQMSRSVPPPSNEELSTFYKLLSKTGKPAILSLQQEYSDAYILDYSKLSTPLCFLFDEKYLDLPYPELLERCEEVFEMIQMSTSQAKNIEIVTQAQVRSKLWFIYRAGRVTASKLKSAAHTSMAQPSQSLIKTICYPDKYKFTSMATRWGCEHEATARRAYIAQHTRKHVNVSVSEIGLTIHSDLPHFGASPDGIVSCDCCGQGVVEIKCPFSCRERNFQKASEDSPSFCLEISQDGEFQLKHQHAYFYQIQLQMRLCEMDYGDFVIWRESELVVLRIRMDSAFVKEAMGKATEFFKYGVLPELLGRWYTRNPPVVLIGSDTTDSDHSCDPAHNDDRFCYCREERDDQLIGCDGDNCSIEWFHMKCLRIKRVPKGKWYCPDCRKKKTKSKT